MPTNLHKVQRSALKLLEAEDSEALFKACVKEAIKLANAKYGSLYLYKSGNLVRAFSTVPRAYRLKPRKDGNTYKSFKQGKIRVVEKDIIRQIHPEAKKTFESTIFVPLVYQKKRLGVLSLDSLTTKNYSPDEKITLKLFGTFATLTIRNIELYENSQTALRAREFFMSTAAHEFRTPLAVIQAYSELMQKSISKDKQIDQKWVNAIYSNNKKLLHLLNDLLSVSQLKMGTFKYTFVKRNLAEVIQKVVADLSVYTKREIVFVNKLNFEAMSEIDPAKFELLLNNLLSNAIKYSSEETKIKVFLRKNKDNNFVTSVVDKGRGIAKKHLPFIFERFYQGNSGSKGMGIGLYLCKEIVEAHDGEIKITSKEGVGTKVKAYLSEA